jgi:uncharacterized protein (TIGR03083 family)
LTNTPTPVADIEPITRAEALALARTEQTRIISALNCLGDDDWLKPTACTGWDVRCVAGHLLGAAEGFSSVGRFAHLMRAARREAAGGSFVDGMTAVQIRECAHLTSTELVARLRSAGPQFVRFRSRVPAPIRALPIKQVLLDGSTETWKVGYLIDIILLRDTWMHRLDITSAVGQDPVLTADHDGRIVANALAEWAQRHGQPFTIELTGPAGDTFTTGAGGQAIRLDATAFCQILSGRGTGPGVLSQQIPF